MHNCAQNGAPCRISTETKLLRNCPTPSNTNKSIPKGARSARSPRHLCAWQAALPACALHSGCLSSCSFCSTRYCLEGKLLSGFSNLHSRRCTQDSGMLPASGWFRSDAFHCAPVVVHSTWFMCCRLCALQLAMPPSPHSCCTQCPQPSRHSHTSSCLSISWLSLMRSNRFISAIFCC